MALQAFGYSKSRSEILFAQCDGFTISLKGPKVHPKVGRLELHSNVTSKIRIEGPDFHSLTTPDIDTKESNVEIPTPLFFEETDYELIVEKLDSGDSVDFYHRTQSLRNAYGKVGRSGNVSSAILNFGSQVGYSELVFSRAGRKAVSIIIEIFPTKIDYQKDWKELLERISSSLFSLAYGFLTSTFQTGKVAPESTKTLGQWYSLLEPRFEELLQSVDYIARNPNRAIVKHYTVRRLAQVRRPDSSVRRWLQRHPRAMDKVPTNTPGSIQTISGAHLPRRLPGSKSKLTFDTRENRFLKKLLENVILKLSRLERVYRQNCEGFNGRILDEEFIAKVKNQQRQIRRRLQYDFLAEVGSRLYEGQLSTVLQFSPGYRNVFEVGLALQLGLVLSEGIEHIELKNVHELYEIWCFLELDNILSELTVAKSNSIAPFENKELYWALVRNKEGGAKYKTALGDEILLQYNTSESTPTGSHRPDNLLSIKKAGSEHPFRFVLDAKYRIYADDCRTGPMVDDINAMHRYRDALVTVKGAAKRSVTEAIVLFPAGDEESHLSNQYYKSIEKVGVGALPFLPGSKLLVENLLKRWLTEPTTEIDEHSVGVEKHSRDGLVLIGPISPKLKLEDIEKLGFYHVPKKRLALENRPITHVALYEPKSNDHDGIIRRLYPIIGWDLVPRNKLNIAGSDSKNSEMYYRIDLNTEEIEELLVPKQRRVSPGIRNHRYIPLSVFDSTNIIDVMAADEEVSKMRLRVYRYLEFMRNAKSPDTADWQLEIRGKSTKVLKVKKGNNLVLEFGDQSTILGTLDSNISVAQIVDKVIV